MASKKRPEGSNETLPVLAPYSEEGKSLAWDDEGGKVIALEVPDDMASGSAASLISKRAKEPGMQARRQPAPQQQVAPQMTPDDMFRQVMQQYADMAAAPAAVQPQFEKPPSPTEDQSHVPTWLAKYMAETGGK